MTKQEWINKTQYWKKKWSVSQDQGEKLNDDLDGLNIYRFINSLNENLKNDSCIVSDAGSSLYSCGQNLKLSKNQRWICSWAQSEMGAALGMATGASLVRDKKEAIVVTGDGSFHFQVPVLNTIKYFNLPVKIFILQNFGYLSIKNTMDKFYEGRRIGTDSNDGLFFPKIDKIADAYEIKYLKVNKIINIDSTIKQVMSLNEPCIVEVICQEIQDISPAITASKNKDGKLEQNDFSNMFPFLTKEEHDVEMIKD